MATGMNNRTSTHRLAALKSFVGVIRGFAEGSVVALGFALAILAIGTPIVLLVRGLHDGVSWLVRLPAETSALVDAIIPVSSVVGSLVVATVFVRLLVGFFNWRRRLRGRVVGGRAADMRLNPETAGAA